MTSLKYYPQLERERQPEASDEYHCGKFVATKGMVGRTERQYRFTHDRTPCQNPLGVRVYVEKPSWSASLYTCTLHDEQAVDRLASLLTD